VKLKYLDKWNARRTSLAGRYFEELESLPGIGLPNVPDWAEPVWHLFTITAKKRAKLQRYLASVNIETLIHYPVPPFLSDAYKRDGEWNSFPISEQIANNILSLPIGPHLSDIHLDVVCDSVAKFFKSQKI
jgi:dTDP-4-amino-4,6-dideoxygalactose transaminase